MDGAVIARLVLVLVLLGALVALVEWVPAHYIAEGKSLAVAARAKQDAQHLADDTADALKKEREFNAKLAAAEAQRLKEKADHEKDKADAVRVARAGNSGMRCPAATVHPHTPAGSAATGAGSGPAQDDRLVPEAAGDILDIAATGAQNVRDYNRLADEYDALVLFCNVKPVGQSGK